MEVAESVVRLKSVEDAEVKMDPNPEAMEPEDNAPTPVREEFTTREPRVVAFSTDVPLMKYPLPDPRLRLLVTDRPPAPVNDPPPCTVRPLENVEVAVTVRVLVDEVPIVTLPESVERPCTWMLEVEALPVMAR